MSSASGALEKTFECVSCEDEIRDIVELIDHAAGECDDIIPADALSSNEKSTLLYIEAMVVDNNAKLDEQSMNHEDIQNIKFFGAAGLLDVEEIEYMTKKVVTFTDEAWDLAAECRKRRGIENIGE